MMRLAKITPRFSRASHRGWAFLLLVCVASPAFARHKKSNTPQAKLTPDMVRLIDQASIHERGVLLALQQRAPVVETYIQDFKPDTLLSAIPTEDHYFLGRVDFGRVIEDNRYQEASTKKAMYKGSVMFVNGLTKAFKIEYVAQGFVQMLLLDPTTSIVEHYNFQFVRREFLGDIRTELFDVTPKPGSGPGRFIGRVWIEDTGGNIVRFSGTYTSKNGRHVYYHFDSWRTNVQPNLWLPTAVYAEEHGPGERTGRRQTFSAHKHGSGDTTCVLRFPPALTPQYRSTRSKTPAKTRRMSVHCRPRACGRSRRNPTFSTASFKPVCSPHPAASIRLSSRSRTILILTNNIALPEAVHCRVLLTTPLESLTIGNTIVLSKGLIDTLPSEAALAPCCPSNWRTLPWGTKSIPSLPSRIT